MGKCAKGTIPTVVVLLPVFAFHYFIVLEVETLGGWVGHVLRWGAVLGGCSVYPMRELTLISKGATLWTTEVLTEHCFVFLRILVHWLFDRVIFVSPYWYVEIHAHFYRLIYCYLLYVFNNIFLYQRHFQIKI